MSLASIRVDNFFGHPRRALPRVDTRVKNIFRHSTSGGRYVSTSARFFHMPFFSRSCSLLFKQHSREFALCAKTRKPPRRFPIGRVKRRRPRILLRCWQKPPLSTRFLNECVADPFTAHRWCARFFPLLKKAPNPIPRRNPNFSSELRQRSTFCSKLRHINFTVSGQH